MAVAKVISPTEKLADAINESQDVTRALTWFYQIIEENETLRETVAQQQEQIEALEAQNAAPRQRSIFARQPA